MKPLISKSGIGLMILAFVFCLFGTVASASKLEMYELGERIRVLQGKIDVAYEELRKLNEEGGEQAQEQAQLIMGMIKEMKAEKQVLQKNLEKLKNNGGSSNLSDNQDFRKDAERLKKLDKR